MNDLTKEEEKSVAFLVKELSKAIDTKNLDNANKAINLLQQILRPKKKETRLMKYKCMFFEAYMEAAQYDYAISGFTGIIQKVNDNTRLYLEANALLAICYIRINDIEKAEPLINKVLRNDKVITTKEKRFEFRKAIIDRFKEEGILIGLKSSYKEAINSDDINNEVLVLINLSEEKLYENLGNNVPPSSLDIFFKIDNFSRKQLPFDEQKKLPAPAQVTDKVGLGKSLFSSLKRTFHNALCDPTSETYKLWNKNINYVIQGVNIIDAVVSSLKGFGIALRNILAPLITLIMRFGIEWYCTHKQPKKVMDLR